ncbi:MAG TPA: sulfatase-like hydrolase/transferase, partial [Taishania sp.]|nr:sulfatase-like hydrolase/transferase [Taishania sp.]
MRFFEKIPIYLRNFIQQMLFVWVAMSFTRGLFHLLNSQAFSNVTFYDYFIGAWFDLITLSLIFLPYALIYLLPFSPTIRQAKWYRFSCSFLFVTITLLAIGLNLMDIEYFKYTSKRSTADLLAILTAGSDLKQLITTFITDFWYIILIFILLVIGVVKLYFRWSNEKQTQHQPLWKGIMVYLLALATMVFIGRGGIVFKPVGVLDVSRFVQSSKTALVLNTPFTMLKSIGSEGLEKVNYYPSIAATERYFNPIKTSHPQGILPKNTNVVVLILESFGKEFIGYYTREKSYTPFLDSLLGESLVFDAGFANGKKSIEAVPSIFASIPSLQDNPYISSQYNSNRIVGLPELLKKHGYESAFYHGATNGSMRFDAFADYIG